MSKNHIEKTGKKTPWNGSLYGVITENYGENLHL